MLLNRLDWPDYSAVFTRVRMHLAQRTFRTIRPFSMTLMVWRLGRNVRGVALLDQGRLRPKVVFLPQCAHFAILQFLSYTEAVVKTPNRSCRPEAA